MEANGDGLEAVMLAVGVLGTSCALVGGARMVARMDLFVLMALHDTYSNKTKRNTHTYTHILTHTQLR